MSESKHMPGKLERNSIRGWELWIGADYHIADVHGQLESRRANAKHLVKCWNSHDALLDACKAAEIMLLQSNWLGDPRMNIVHAAIEQAEKEG